MQVRGRQDRHDRVRTRAGGALGARQQPDERMPGGHASQLDRRQRPQIVNLEDEAGAASARDRASPVDVEGVRGGGDDDVRPEALREHPAALPDLRGEGHDVDGAAYPVAVVARQLQPLELDAVHQLATDAATQDGIVRSHVRRRAGDDQRLVTHGLPLPGERVRPELHAVPRRSCVLVDEKDAQSRAHCLLASASWLRAAASLSTVARPGSAEIACS